METKTDSRLILAFVILLVAYMLWPLKSGELWIIDDHEIVYAAHQYDSLEAKSFFSGYTTLLRETEVGSPDTASRYRPVYYAIRILKCVLIGDNAKAWFLLNAAYCLIGVIALGFALDKYFPWYVTLPFISLTMGLPFHQDLWPRLGPAEIDAFTYCMLFCLAASRLQEKTLWAWPCCNITVALAIGCKENFLLLLLPLAMLAIYGLMQKKLQPRRLWWMAFPIFTAYPVARVIIRTIERTNNIYMQDTSAQSLLDKMVLFFTSGVFFIYAASCAALLFLYFVARNWNRSDSLRQLLPVPLKQRDIYRSLTIIFTLIALIAGNFIFYYGYPNPFSRYGFPYYFLLPMFMVCLLYPLLSNIIRGYASFGKFKSTVTILGIVAIVATWPFIHKNTSNIRTQIQHTVDFWSALKEAQGYREVFLINPGGMLLSYEQYFSLKRYEAAKYLSFVSYFPIFGEPESELDRVLESGLRSAISNQPPLTLAPDVILWQSYGGRLKRVEHTRDSRNIEELVTAFHVQYANDDFALIASLIVFYIPVNDHVITGIKLIGSGENNPAAWRISVNDQVINEKNISYGENSFIINLSEIKPGDFTHPQLYKLSFEPNEENAPALRLRSLHLLR